MRSGVGWGRVTRASYTAPGRRASEGSGGGRESQISESDEHFDAVARLFQGPAPPPPRAARGGTTRDPPASAFTAAGGPGAQPPGLVTTSDPAHARRRGAAPLDPA